MINYEMDDVDDFMVEYCELMTGKSTYKHN